MMNFSNQIFQKYKAILAHSSKFYISLGFMNSSNFSHQIIMLYATFPVPSTPNNKINVCSYCLTNVALYNIYRGGSRIF